MDFLSMAKKRYSVRCYNGRQVERDKLDKVLEAGRIAPTGVNAQPQRLIVIQSEAGMEKLSRCMKIFGAPTVILVCADTDKTWKRPYDGKDIADIDASIVTTYMMLQATELELSTLWMCCFKPDMIREEFNLPDNLVPVNILLLGYTDGEPKSPDRYDTDRKPIESTVSYESL